MQTAADVIVFARKYAVDRRQLCVGTGELLLGLFSPPVGPAARALTICGAAESAVRSELEKIIGPPAHDGEYDLYCPTVPRVNKAIELANREAKNRGHAEVGSEHLLIALISDDESLATALLLGLGVDLSVLATTLAKEAGWLR